MHVSSSVVYLIYILTQLPPEQAAPDLANITSNTAEISAVDVSLATSIIENLTTAAIVNEEVCELAVPQMTVIANEEVCNFYISADGR